MLRVPGTHGVYLHGDDLLKMADLLEKKQHEVAIAREIRKSASFRSRRITLRLSEGAAVGLQSLAVKFGAGIVADPKLQQKIRYSLCPCPFFTINIYTTLALLFFIWATVRRRRSRNVAVARRSCLLLVCCKTPLWADLFVGGLL